jgi:pilus assembly protein CpaC
MIFMPGIPAARRSSARHRRVDGDICGSSSARRRGLRRLAVAACLVALLPAWPLRAVAKDAAPIATEPLALSVGHGRILHFDDGLDSVFIADPTIADVRVVAPDVVYTYGKKIGTTNLIAVAARDKRRVNMEITVAIDDRAPNEAERQLHPTSTIEISLLGSRVAVTGQTGSIEGATGAAAVAQTYSPAGQPPVNESTITGSQQVNIRVRFAEVSRNELRAFGFTWRLLSGSSNFGFPGKVNVDVLIEALERAGALTILAEPNLTAITGQTASFLAGGEVPVPVPQGRGDIITVDYKPIGVSLDFTPTLIRTNRIAMHVRPSVSAISESGAVKVGSAVIPSFTVRRAETTVELASGQTFALAGLFQRQMSQDVDKFPVLGDIPVIGALFRSERFRRDETELVILITPYLVEPMRERVAATPLDGPERFVSRTPSRQSGAGPVSGLIFK